jgi:hypothetical protein
VPEDDMFFNVSRKEHRDMASQLAHTINAIRGDISSLLTQQNKDGRKLDEALKSIEELKEENSDLRYKIFSLEYKAESSQIPNCPNCHDLLYRSHSQEKRKMLLGLRSSLHSGESATIKCEHCDSTHEIASSPRNSLYIKTSTPPAEK